MDFENQNKEVKKEESKELTQAQKIRAKIKELRELETIEKKIAKTKSDLQKLKDKKFELEQKYNL
jgi:hypothetical protein